MQRSHHEPRVLALLQMLGLGHHPSRTTPAFLRLIDELFEPPGRATSLLVLCFRLLPLLHDLRLQTFVFRQSQQVLYAVRFTPSHQLLAAKSGVSPHHDAHPRPYGTNLCHDALQLFHTSRRGIDVRRSQPRTQQELSAKDVQRQIAIVPVIAMEETPFPCFPCSGSSVASRSRMISFGASRWAP